MIGRRSGLDLSVRVSCRILCMSQSYRVVYKSILSLWSYKPIILRVVVFRQ